MAASHSGMIVCRNHTQRAVHWEVDRPPLCLLLFSSLSAHPPRKTFRSLPGPVGWSSHHRQLRRSPGGSGLPHRPADGQPSVRGDDHPGGGRRLSQRCLRYRLQKCRSRADHGEKSLGNLRQAATHLGSRGLLSSIIVRLPL